MCVSSERSERVSVGDQSSECVAEFGYLGDVISAGIGTEAGSVTRD